MDFLGFFLAAAIVFSVGYVIANAFKDDGDEP